MCLVAWFGYKWHSEEYEGPLRKTSGTTVRGLATWTSRASVVAIWDSRLWEDDVGDPWTREKDVSASYKVTPMTESGGLTFSLQTEACWTALSCLDLSWF